MSSNKYLKCYFGCQTNGVLHYFPNPNYNEERFNLWLEKLANDVRERGPQYIYNNVRHCSDHFEPYFRTPSDKLTRNAIPTLNCDPGKLMLKESASPITSAAVGEAEANEVTGVTGGARPKGVVVRATPVRAPPRVQVFALHNKLPGSLQQVKIVQKADIKSTSGPKVTPLKVKACAPAVKIVLNEASFNKNLASQPNQASQQVIHQASQQLPISDMEVETVSETVKWMSVLRAQLKAAQAKMRKLQTAPAKIQELQAELNKTRAQLNKTRAQLNKTRAQLNKTRAQLNKTRAQLNKTRAQLNKTRAQLNKTRAQLNKTRAQLNKTRAQLNKTRERLAQYEPPDH